MLNSQIVNRDSLAGVGATLIGNGIGRFAYIALMPALIQSGWFSESDASYLGVATLLGYLLGAPAANVLLRFFSAGSLIRAAMLVSSFSYLGCAVQEAPLSWFYAWRTLAGVAGALLMVVAPPVIVRKYSPSIKARISGVIFSGIGIGAMLSGTLIPFLIYFSVTTAWVGMGVVALVTTLLTWHSWGSESSGSNALFIQASFSQLSSTQRRSVILILLAYTFDAIGYLPHTLFWVDYIVRELGMSLETGGFFWATFGIGAAIGPIITGFCGDKLGLKRSLCMAFGLKGLGVFLPLISTHPVALFISSLLVGVFTPGTVTLVSTYALECVGYELHTKAWGRMTLSFALSQGFFGFLMAYYLSQFGPYNVLFMISASALFMSVACIWFTNTRNMNEQVVLST
ncbi:YbfB/YjiJ family MFS transporter [Vibrio tapetis subsp. quintayensis]|uniref:YbfB/YjiJ family MFS transporter n=1 Tax=Vibrio tapetis TaxID=52443 RepID=UPI0025B54A23|nr:YbfB/YjiJ family MFS transporter [Vibrio tapetis]MDN3678759.1 YbfB/YjiJ family MFS transporter [Vibrio tapetis subsp. quintayensis]